MEQRVAQPGTGRKHTSRAVNGAFAFTVFRRRTDSILSDEFVRHPFYIRIRTPERAEFCRSRRISRRGARSECRADAKCKLAA